jgi:hypothetical protein
MECSTKVTAHVLIRQNNRVILGEGSVSERQVRFLQSGYCSFRSVLSYGRFSAKGKERRTGCVYDRNTKETQGGER